MTPVPRGKPVQVDKFPVDGVPRAGVTKLGDCNVTPDKDVAVAPNAIEVVPIVIGVAKFVSSSAKGIGPVCDAKLFGTAIL